jgi:hypothetical protein
MVWTPAVPLTYHTSDTSAGEVIAVARRSCVCLLMVRLFSLPRHAHVRCLFIVHKSAIYCPFLRFFCLSIGAESDLGNWNSVLSDKGTSPLQKRYYEEKIQTSHIYIYIYTHTHTHTHRITSNVRRTFYTIFLVGKLRCVLNSRNVTLSGLFS